MKCLIDGYNLLKWLVGASKVTPRQLADFLHIMQLYAHKKKHMLVIIFDGQGFTTQHTSSKNAFFTVIYAGESISADEYIIEYLQAYGQTSHVVVTSDRTLSKLAVEVGATVISIQEFWHALMNELSSKQTNKIRPIKTNEQTNSMLDELMYQNVMIDIKEESGLVKAERSKRTLSKRESKKAHILKKL